MDSSDAMCVCCGPQFGVQLKDFIELRPFRIDFGPDKFWVTHDFLVEMEEDEIERLCKNGLIRPTNPPPEEIPLCGSKIRQIHNYMIFAASAWEFLCRNVGAEQRDDIVRWAMMCQSWAWHLHGCQMSLFQRGCQRTGLIPVSTWQKCTSTRWGPTAIESACSCKSAAGSRANSGRQLSEGQPSLCLMAGKNGICRFT